MKKYISLALAVLILFSVAMHFSPVAYAENSAQTGIPSSSLTAKDIPQYSGELAIVINDNFPEFYVQDLTLQEYAHYSEFDKLGRSGVAVAHKKYLCQMRSAS